MSKHSPLPWKFEQHSEINPHVYSILHADSEAPGSFSVADLATKEDAAHIVRCVNNFDALVEALKLIAAQDQGCGGRVTEAEAWRSAQSIARAALSAARSEP